MSTALATIRNWSETHRTSIAIKRSGGRNPNPETVFNQMSASQFPGQADPEQYQSMMAYHSNTGEAYSAMRPARQRIAGQPVHVAEIVSARDESGKRKSFNAYKTAGRRELSPEETAILPKWIRQKLHLPEHPELGHRIKLHKSFYSEAARIEILDSHPVLDLLSHPVPRLTQHTLLETSVASLQMTGRCFWWITDSPQDRPFDLWYVPTHWMREQPDNAYLDKGFILTPPFNQIEGEPLPADRVIYFYANDPANMFLSHCPMRAGILAVQVDESIRLSQRQFFENSVLPWLGIITGDIIGPDGKSQGKPQLDRFQINQIMQRVQHLHQGASKAGRAIVFDRVIDDIKKISNTANEMDWMESGTYNRDSIWRNFGTPRVVAGDITDANRATALVADETFLRNIVNPQINMISSIMDERLLPLYSKGKKRNNLVLWIEEATSSDTDGRRNDLQLLAANGGIIIDEMRAAFGMPPMPNGMGKMRITTAMQILEPIDDEAAAALDVRDEYLPETQPAGKPPAQQKPTQNPAKVPPEPKQVIFIESKDFETSWLKLHGNNERPYAADVTKFLNAQVSSICKRAESGSTDADELFTPNQWDAPLIKLSKPHLMRSGIAGAALAEARHKAFVKSDNVMITLPESVQHAIWESLDESLSKPYWKDINVTTLNRLVTTLSESIDKGETTTERIARIQKELGGRAAGARGLMIARTETTGMLNAGARAQIDELIEMGSAVPPEWLTTMDEHARNSHWDANGQKADSEGNFTIGGEKCRYPGDPNLTAKERAGCRCSII